MAQPLPDILRRLRLESGQTLAETSSKLAEHGIIKSRATVHNWEAGRGLPPREALDGLATVWALDIADATELYMAAGYIVQLAPPVSV